MKLYPNYETEISFKYLKKSKQTEGWAIWAPKISI